jgi:hypothetical protein
MQYPVKRSFFPALLALALAAGPAAAQTPSVQAVFPPGGRPGTSFEVTISGGNLGEIREVLVSGDGVSVFPGEGDAANVKALVSVAAGAGIGLRELRVVTSRGISNAGRLWIGQYPNLLEAEPNNTLEQAQQLTYFPVTINGRAEGGEDVDHFSFVAGAGETWVFELAATSFHSGLDGYLTLMDERGRLQAFAMENFDRDPRLVHTFTRAGRYVIQVRDTLYRGGPALTYRLTVGQLPVVERWSPMAALPGSQVTVRLFGANLNGDPVLQVAAPERRGEERVVRPIDLLHPGEGIRILAEDRADTPEVEPNDTPAQATRIERLPAVASGHIGTSGDRDYFVFTAAAMQVVGIDLTARALGSRLHPVVRIKDGDGKELAANNDTIGRDSRLSFTAPAAGDYFVEVRGLGPQSGDGYFYRLRLTDPPQPDFSLAVTPDNPSVPAGGSVAVTLTARRTGYNGPIVLRFENLPPGVTAAEVSLREGQNVIVTTLTAAADAEPAQAPLRVVGTGKIGEAEFERVGVGEEQYQLPLTNADQARLSRTTKLLSAASGTAAPYTLSVEMPDPDVREVKVGEKLEFTVKATRQEEFKQNIAVTVLGLPGNVTASALTINADQTEGKITLTAAGNAAVGATSIVIQGSAQNIVVAAPAVPFTVQPKE